MKSHKSYKSDEVRPVMQRTILSTADVARLFNVTETTVKRWADEGVLRCQKTPGGHRRFVIKYVVEFA
jgi:excisionase family DNA binding protein